MSNQDKRIEAESPKYVLAGTNIPAGAVDKARMVNWEWVQGQMPNPPYMPEDAKNIHNYGFMHGVTWILDQLEGYGAPGNPAARDNEREAQNE